MRLLRRFRPDSARTAIPRPALDASRGANLGGAVAAWAVGTNLGGNLPVGCVTQPVLLHAVPHREATIKEDGFGRPTPSQ